VIEWLIVASGPAVTVGIVIGAWLAERRPEPPRCAHRSPDDAGRCFKDAGHRGDHHARATGDLALRMMPNRWSNDASVGSATAHSIEDPFTGDITVDVRLY
jgi:hypothetical protein